MWWSKCFKRPHGRPAARSSSPRLGVERLEDRTVPANFTAANVTDLIADINQSNLLGGQNTITLAAGARFTLTAIDNSVHGATGLPVVAAGDDLTIVGNGDIIERATSGGTPEFRLFDVAAGATLALTHMTLQGGRASDRGAAAGGALYSLGTLTLDGVTVQDNVAAGAMGCSAYGGGIWSGGVLTMVGNTIIRNNQAIGGAGSFSIDEIDVVDAFGGGVFIGGGTATLNGATLSGNVAQGGRGSDGFTYTDPFSGSTDVEPPGNGGSGYGGGLFAYSGTVELHNTTVSGNAARGGAGGHGKPHADPGAGVGGGLYLGPLAAVCLDAFTQAHVIQNKASTSDPNIDGSWIPC